jgi:hypothetical protein
LSSKINKKSSSQASWAVIMEGVSSSRVEAHRIRHLISRVQKLIDNSSEKEHLYQVAGDIIVSLPQKLNKLENSLDRTSYALSIMGQDFLRGRLPLSDRNQVQESIESAVRMKKESSRRVAYRFLCDYEND